MKGILFSLILLSSIEASFSKTIVCTEEQPSVSWEPHRVLTITEIGNPTDGEIKKAQYMYKLIDIEDLDTILKVEVKLEKTYAGKDSDFFTTKAKSFAQIKGTSYKINEHDTHKFIFELSLNKMKEAKLYILNNDMETGGETVKLDCIYTK